ncbi:MAG: hypothetical protein FWH05_08700 [Oscillospiraceae bacterium]|nr:hypothetical protein [Oscillospiraceae bacterium]
MSKENKKNVSNSDTNNAPTKINSGWNGYTASTPVTATSGIIFVVRTAPCA